MIKAPLSDSGLPIQQLRFHSTGTIGLEGEPWHVEGACRHRLGQQGEER